MKKLILMTSALTLVAGVAAAQSSSSLSGEVVLQYGNWGTGGGAASFAQSTKFTASIEQGTPDLMFSGELSISVDLAGNTISQGVFGVSGNFGTFEFGQDAFGNLVDGGGNDAGDLHYAYDSGAFSVDVEANAPGVGNNATNAWWATLGYSGDGFNASLETQADGWAKISADTSFGNFKVGGSVDNSAPAVWDVWTSTTMGGVDAKFSYNSAGTAGVDLSGDANGVSWSVGFDTNNVLTADVSAPMGDATIDVAFDSSNAGGNGDNAQVIVTVSYPVIDGLDLEVKANSASEYQAKMTGKVTFN